MAVVRVGELSRRGGSPNPRRAPRPPRRHFALQHPQDRNVPRGAGAQGVLHHAQVGRQAAARGRAQRARHQPAGRSGARRTSPATTLKQHPRQGTTAMHVTQLVRRAREGNQGSPRSCPARPSPALPCRARSLQVFPWGMLAALLPGTTAEVWMEPGKPASDMVSRLATAAMRDAARVRSAARVARGSSRRATRENLRGRVTWRWARCRRCCTSARPRASWARAASRRCWVSAW